MAKGFLNVSRRLGKTGVTSLKMLRIRYDNMDEIFSCINKGKLIQAALIKTAPNKSKKPIKQVTE